MSIPDAVLQDAIIAYHCSVQGANHIKSDKPCEDASAHFAEDGLYICAVADGHGSSEYPRTEKGSQFAVECTIRLLKEFIANVTAADLCGSKCNETIGQLEKSILNEWHLSVQADLDQTPFSEEELASVSEKSRIRYSSENASDRHKAYGTTLIAFALTDTFAIGIQIGDGKAVVFDSDMKPSVPIPDDESCQMNITTSLCDDDAINEFRYVTYTTGIPIAFFCGTDGIDDSYVSEEDLYAFYEGVLSLFAEYGSDTAEKEIEEYLPVLTQKGSGDDVSVALIVNMPMIKKAVARYAADAEQIQTNDISEMSPIETENANPSE